MVEENEYVEKLKSKQHDQENTLNQLSASIGQLEVQLEQARTNLLRNQGALQMLNIIIKEESPEEEETKEGEDETPTPPKKKKRPAKKAAKKKVASAEEEEEEEDEEL